ncbi:cystatin C (amyloid angiopathy and cerebral hemorrhage) [Etheostoma cragini]|uniref:cystatin C (amyloid angiopathy and cerebral hemorrhage) n=1 Tax=Etheostoma cragini TaxID=417921 RepID=UPI00155F12EB|nr:cystatin C (amyloid angiopathy and cerebral hemorrhage) [Etheostoma cragini]
MMWKVVFPVLAAVFAVGSGGLVGGFSEVDVHDEGVRDALNYAVVQHNKGSNDLYLSQVAEVLKAQRQVVAGMKYIITVKMAKTPCRKGRENDVCDIHQDRAKAQPYQCTFTVWNRPWLNEIQMVAETC